MNLIVCVKQITQFYVQSAFELGSTKLVQEGRVRLINPYDEVAIEEALRLKERHGGRITLVSLGPSDAEKALKWGLAMGADEAIHVVAERDRNMNPWPTAEALAAVIRTIPHDVLFFGRMALDDGMGQVGTFVAELLDLPVVTAVVQLDMVPEEKRADLQRSLERGNREKATCQLPAVFTVEKTLNNPRYPTLPGRHAARKANIKKLEKSYSNIKEECGLELTALTPPKIRPKKVLMPDSGLSAAGRMKFIMSGGKGKKKGGQIQGDPKSMARGILDLIMEKNFLSVKDLGR